jgi:RHH-type proline utilization regulon transcriptional repressor/proline dehydrogenase/delta 1-pyrroline-5-carboxylate dehydrogenase
LPEQVTDDVIASAFRSAGQRCSALRLLCVQEDVADRVLDMVVGATRELSLGDPRNLATHVGPVIDSEARSKLDRWIAMMESRGAVPFRLDASGLPASGTYVAPTIIELDSARELREEVFGPVLHVVRWRSGELDRLLDDIAANDTALTLGVQSRIETVIAKIAERMPHGNIYVNRNMIGAVVGSQPFGGSHLSGTGPKAGGSNYLRRFAHEQAITVNTAASGGNATLLSEEE